MPVYTIKFWMIYDCFTHVRNDDLPDPSGSVKTILQCGRFDDQNVSLKQEHLRSPDVSHLQMTSPESPAPRLFGRNAPRPPHGAHAPTWVRIDGAAASIPTRTFITVKKKSLDAIFYSIFLHCIRLSIDIIFDFCILINCYICICMYITKTNISYHMTF